MEPRGYISLNDSKYHGHYVRLNIHEIPVCPFLSNMEPIEMVIRFKHFQELILERGISDP